MENRNMSAARPSPIIKWAGGKGQLLNQYEPLFPSNFQNYHEPFVGGAAVFFHLSPRLNEKQVWLTDGNEEIINLYQVVRDAVEEVIAHLERHQRQHCVQHYYIVRAQNPADLPPAERAARTIYLNKTCYNGLYRVNSRGQFNVPMGRYKNPAILNAEALRLASRALQGVRLLACDFAKVVERAEPGDFVYFDPPYHPLSSTANFTAYTAASFDEREQERLAEVYRALDKKGCLLMLSNSDTPLVRRLYASYDIRVIRARRAVNSRGDRRGPIDEVVVRNYGDDIQRRAQSSMGRSDSNRERPLSLSEYSTRGGVSQTTLRLIKPSFSSSFRRVERMLLLTPSNAASNSLNRFVPAPSS